MAQHAPENRPMLTRLTEQAIVGIAAAAIALYANNIRQDDAIQNLTSQVVELKRAVEVMRAELYVPRTKR